MLKHLPDIYTFIYIMYISFFIYIVMINDSFWFLYIWELVWSKIKHPHLSFKNYSAVHRNSLFDNQKLFNPSFLLARIFPCLDLPCLRVLDVFLVKEPRNVDTAAASQVSSRLFGGSCRLVLPPRTGWWWLPEQVRSSLSS